MMEDCMIEQPEPAEPAFGWPSVCRGCGAREPADCECVESARTGGGVTRYERYMAALARLRSAAEAIEHACALLKGFKIVAHTRASKSDSKRQWLSNQVFELAREVENAKCPECGHALLNHSSRINGCSGDDNKPWTVCGCPWGKEEKTGDL